MRALDVSGEADGSPLMESTVSVSLSWPHLMILGVKPPGGMKKELRTLGAGASSRAACCVLGRPPGRGVNRTLVSMDTSL